MAECVLPSCSDQSPHKRECIRRLEVSINQPDVVVTLIKIDSNRVSERVLQGEEKIHAMGICKYRGLDERACPRMIVKRNVSPKNRLTYQTCQADGRRVKHYLPDLLGRTHQHKYCGATVFHGLHLCWYCGSAADDAMVDYFHLLRET